MVISTGEQIPTGGGESTVARLFIVDTQREAMDLAKLTHIQNNVHLLRKATGSFIDLIRPDLDSRVERMTTLWEELAHRTPRKGHLRVPEAAAFLRIGAQAGLEAIRDMGVIDAKTYDTRLKACDDAIQELAVRQSDRVQEERPSLKFLRLVHELLVGRQICLNTCGTPGCMQDVGWHDQHFYYLISGLVMDKVKSFSQKSDEYFGLSAKALHKQLFEDGFTIRSESGNRYLVKARIPEKTAWSGPSNSNARPLIKLQNGSHTIQLPKKSQVKNWRGRGSKSGDCGDRKPQCSQISQIFRDGGYFSCQ